jgi:hypothetical protein
MQQSLACLLFLRRTQKIEDVMSYWFKREDENKRFPPRRRHAPIPPGQSYEEMLEKHGRPFGPFDKDRLLPYSAKEEDR